MPRHEANTAGKVLATARMPRQGCRSVNLARGASPVQCLRVDGRHTSQGAVHGYAEPQFGMFTKMGTVFDWEKVSWAGRPCHTTLLRLLRHHLQLQLLRVPNHRKRAA